MHIRIHTYSGWNVDSAGTAYVEHRRFRRSNERRKKSSKGIEDLYLQAHARLWPGVGCVCHTPLPSEEEAF